MASTLSFELRRIDGTPADPPRLTTVAAMWRPGDAIPLGRYSLRVVEVRDGEHEHSTVLVVEQRQVRRSVLQRLQRRELMGQTRDQKLVEPLRLRQILQTVVAQITQGEPLVDQIKRCLRQKHLPTMTSGHHTRSPMNV